MRKGIFEVRCSSPTVKEGIATNLIVLEPSLTVGLLHRVRLPNLKI
jgi:hypothetical protein